MSSFAPSYREYRRGTNDEMDVRSRVTDERHRRLGRGDYDTRSPSEKKRDNIENLFTVATLALPIGWAYRGLRALHYGARFGKGARPIVFAGKGGKQQVRFYDASRKRFISKSEYHAREGIGATPRARALYKKAEQKVESTRVVRLARKGSRTYRLVDQGPSAYMRQRFLDKVIPRPIQWATAGALAYDRTTDFIDDITSDDDTSGSYRRYRTTVVLNKHQPLPGSNQSKFGLKSITSTSGSLPSPRCPPGYRYDRGTRSCVPLRK
jgi:hypothetical protein